MDSVVKEKKPLLKRWWFWVVAVLVLLMLVPGRSKEEIAKEEREKAVADSISGIRRSQDSARAAFVADSEQKAFAKLPKKDQERILAARREAAVRESMEQNLRDSDKKFHIKYIAQKYIESNLKNPDSFDEKSTSDPEVFVSDGMAAFRVMVTYTATNSFGATIQDRKIVIVDATGTSALMALNPR